MLAWLLRSSLLRSPASSFVVVYVKCACCRRRRCLVRERCCGCSGVSVPVGERCDRAQSPHTPHPRCTGRCPCMLTLRPRMWLLVCPCFCAWPQMCGAVSVLASLHDRRDVYELRCLKPLRNAIAPFAHDLSAKVCVVYGTLLLQRSNSIFPSSFYRSSTSRVHIQCI